MPVSEDMKSRPSFLSGGLRWWRLLHVEKLREMDFLPRHQMRHMRWVADRAGCLCLAVERATDSGRWLARCWRTLTVNEPIEKTHVP